MTMTIADYGPKIMLRVSDPDGAPVWEEELDLMQVAAINQNTATILRNRVQQYRELSAESISRPKPRCPACGKEKPGNDSHF